MWYTIYYGVIMDLEQLQDLADKKLKINDTELDLESLKTPQLHNEFLKHLTKFKLLLSKAQIELQEISGLSILYLNIV